MDAATRHLVLFHEVQRYRKWARALKPLMIGYLPICLGLTFVNLAAALEFITGPDLRNTNFSATMMWGFFGIALCLAVLMICITKFTTEVRSDGLFVKYFPFAERFEQIPLDNLVAISRVGEIDAGTGTLTSIRFLGKLRGRRQLKVYDVDAEGGVILEFAAGKFIVIGSQRQEELMEALRSLVSDEVG